MLTTPAKGLSAPGFYADSALRPWTPSHHRSPAVDVPTAVLAYPTEPAATPRRWAQSYLDLHRYTTKAHGGHFPPIEDPDGLAEYLNTFFHATLTRTR